MLDSQLFFFFYFATVVSLSISVNEHAFISALVTPAYNAKLKWRCSIDYRINILGGKSGQGLCLHLPAEPHVIL